MIVPTTISERVAEVQSEIVRACQRAGRPPESVTLVAVSKTHPVETVMEAVVAGIQHFGENRVEDALPKMREVAQRIDQPIRWHMIGHVQSRKARDVVEGGFALVHSVDSVKLAGRLSRFALEQQRVLDVLLEINVSGEETKEGWNASGWQHDLSLRTSLWQDIQTVLDMPGLVVRGLMTMAPIVDDPEQARPVFADLRELRDTLAHDFPGISWSELSMGMTDDYPVAIEEGATLVRIGRAIFGPRR